MKTFKFADIIDKINDNNMSLMDILLYYETKRNEDIAKESKKEAKETEDYRHQEQFHNYKSQEDKILQLEKEVQDLKAKCDYLNKRVFFLEVKAGPIN